MTMTSFGGIDPNTLTSESRDQYVQELDERMSLYSSPEAEEDKPIEVDEGTDYDALFEEAGLEQCPLPRRSQSWRCSPNRKLD
jgi:hypothetical protein